eukprot:IDg19201t1
MSVFVELPKHRTGNRYRGGCVRFVTKVENSRRQQRNVRFEDVHVFCSCSPSLEAATCAHAAACTRSSAVTSRIADLFGIIELSSRDPIRTCSDLQSPDYLPVFENRTDRRVAMAISKRLQCFYCLRAPLNRGLCSHELAVVAKEPQREDEGARFETRDTLKGGKSRIPGRM